MAGVFLLIAFKVRNCLFSLGVKRNFTFLGFRLGQTVNEVAGRRATARQKISPHFEDWTTFYLMLPHSWDILW